MNSCVLMAEIIKAPELRYTQDGNTAIAEMVVQFPPLRAEDPIPTLRVTGYGNLAQQIQEQFHQGDQVIIEGRLHMRTIDRPEGFKEKLAELRASRVHTLDLSISAGVSTEPNLPPSPQSTSIPAPSMSHPPVASPVPPMPQPQAPVAPPPPQPARPAAPIPSETTEPPNYDDIPF